MRINAIQIAQLFRHLGDGEITDVTVMVALGDLFTGDQSLSDLDSPACEALAAVMVAVKSGDKIPEMFLDPEETAAVQEAWSVVKPPDQPPAAPPPPPVPALPPVEIDAEFALELALGFEFVPPSLNGFRLLAQGSPKTQRLVGGTDGEVKALEIGSVIQAAKANVPSPALKLLSSAEEAEIRSAVQAVVIEAAAPRLAPRFTPLFMLRLEQQVAIGSKPDEIRLALHQDCPEAGCRSVVNTGSFRGLMVAVNTIQRGKEPAKALVLQLRDSELAMLKQVFGKPAPVEVPLTAFAVDLIANCIETENSPGDVAELKCFSKAQTNGARAAIKTYLHKGVAAVKPAAFYGISEADRTAVLDAIKIRNPKVQNPITETVVRELYVAARRGGGGKDDKGPDRFVSEAINGIDPRHVRAAEMMIRNWQQEGSVRSHVSYGIEPALYRQILSWFEKIGREEGGMKVITPPEHPLEAFVRNPMVKQVFDGFKWPVTVIIIVVLVCWALH